MKHLKNLLRMLSILAVCLCFTLPVLAGEEDELRVYPAEDTGSIYLVAPRLATGISTYAAVPTYTAGDSCLAIIKEFEGFSATPYQDTLWLAIGYGSRYSQAQAKYGTNCAPITQEQGIALVKEELQSVEKSLNTFLTTNGITVSQVQFDALASFTYNVGSGWTSYKNTDGSWCKLKELLLKGSAAWTEEKVQEAFGTWVNDGNGKPLAGLVRRRAAEAALFTSSATESAVTFRDVAQSAWYYDDVMEAYEMGLISGMGDGTFAPSASLTRAQLVKMLANFDGVDLSGYTTTEFSDVSGSVWYVSAVAWASEQGYVTGYPDGTFRPEEKVTREQLCTILSRYLEEQQYAAVEGQGSFTDATEISGYAVNHVYACASLGLVTGMGDGSFSPKTGATRAQAAAVFVRMCGLR